MVLKRMFLFLFPFLYLFLMLFRIDSSLQVDLGRQLKMGEVIYTCQCVPQVNLFSLVHPDFPAVNHSWLSQVAFYWFTKSFGLASLLYLKAFLVIVSFAFVYSLSFKKQHLFASVCLGLLCVAIFADRFSVRPELFSYFFLSLLMVLFALYRRSQKMLVLWLVPVVIVVWVNMHIYFFVGILMYLFFLIEQAVKQKKAWSSFFPLTLAVLFAPFLNPSFAQGALYPFFIFGNYGAKIMENYPSLVLLSGNFPLSMEVLVIGLFELLSCIALAGIFIFPKKEFIAQRLNSLVGIILGQLLSRCIALFSLLSLPLLVQEYAYLHNNVAPHIKKRVMRGVNALLITLFILVLLVQMKDATTYPIYGFQLEDTTASAVEFFKKNELKGPIFNNLTVGNYLIYSLYPREKVFIDGRPEAYPASFFQSSGRMLKDHTYFTQQADTYQINVVFFSLLDDPEFTRRFLVRLANDNRWAPVYWDRNVVIFLRNTKENAEIITENKGIKEDLVRDLKAN